MVRLPLKNNLFMLRRTIASVTPSIPAQTLAVRPIEHAARGLGHLPRTDRGRSIDYAGPRLACSAIRTTAMGTAASDSAPHTILARCNGLLGNAA